MKAKYLTYLFIITIFSMQAIACVVNNFIDTSHIWAHYEEMAKLSLQGKIVATSPNYNEREFQHQIIKNQKKIPETIVIGSSRGMFLGTDITNKKSIYNHCVSGGIINDYFAILGLYQKYMKDIPQNIIFEVSPWVFSDVSPEKRWEENNCYRIAAYDFYEITTGKSLMINKYSQSNNPLFSFTYMYTNLIQLLKIIKERNKGKNNKLFFRESENTKERAVMPDGTIRYIEEKETYNPKRTKEVQSTSNKPVSYQKCDRMSNISSTKFNNFKALINYLLKRKINIIIFLAPFSKTQCEYIYNQKTNPIFIEIENKLKEFAKENNIDIIGSYNANKFNLTDDNFIDFMHGDKNLNKIIWNYSYHQ